MKLLICIGTRPEAIKMLPVVQSLRRSSSLQPLVLLTGQHQELAEDVLSTAGIRADFHLDRSSQDGEGLNSISSRVISQMEDIILRIDQLSCVLVHGDTTSSLACSLAAFHMGCPIVHVEAGLRSGDMNNPFPEEANRRLISSLASLHLSPTKQNAQNLIDEQIDPWTIHVVGNSGLDALRWACSLHDHPPHPLLQKLEGQSLAVLTVHRRENWDSGIKGIARAVARIAEEYKNLHWVVPMHPNPLVQKELKPYLEDRHNVHTTQAMEFVQFAQLLQKSYMVVTDSGGLQEEAPVWNKPVLVVRDVTERQEGLEAGTLRLVGSGTERVYDGIKQLLDYPEEYQKMAESSNPYGDGYSAPRIRLIVEDFILGSRGDRKPQETVCV